MAASSEDETSPTCRLKFLCSYGGKIVPRPSDGQFKYIGGETRAVVIPRPVTYSGLMEKLRGMYHVDFVMKYLVMPEELDTLVSVTCDEDLLFMLEEFDHHHLPSGSPSFRVFLFPVHPSSLPTTTGSSNSDQQSVAASKGISMAHISTSTSTTAGYDHSIFTLSSPTSPTYRMDPFVAVSSSQDPRHAGRRTGLTGGMHRVRSTPNMSSYHSQSIGNASGTTSPQAPHQQSHHHQHQRQPHPSVVVPGPQLARLQKQRSVTYGIHTGPRGGPCRSGSTFQPMWYNDCCGYTMTSFQPHQPRPYKCTQALSGCMKVGYGSGSCSCCGKQMDEVYRSATPPKPRLIMRFSSPTSKQEPDWDCNA